MKELYPELLERLKWLHEQPKSMVIDGRILELQLVVIRIQQELIKQIK